MLSFWDFIKEIQLQIDYEIPKDISTELLSKLLKIYDGVKSTDSYTRLHVLNQELPLILHKSSVSHMIIPVVRCKDCRYCYINNYGKSTHTGSCSKHAIIVEYNDYCSKGELRKIE